MGWLSSLAEGHQKTWGERILENGNPLPVVELEAGEYLLFHVQQMGPIDNNGWNMRPKPDHEILAYFQGVQIPLAAWEFNLVRKMCRAFAEGIRTGQDRFSIMPMQRTPEEST